MYPGTLNGHQSLVYRALAEDMMTPGASHDNDSNNVTQNERVLNTLTNNWAGASQQQTRPGTARFSRIAFDRDKPVKFGIWSILWTGNDSGLPSDPLTTIT